MKTPGPRTSHSAMSKYPAPTDALAHTLAVYADEPDEAFAIVATGNIYGPGIRTGLTWGDLRRLANPVP